TGPRAAAGFCAAAIGGASASRAPAILTRDSVRRPVTIGTPGTPGTQTPRPYFTPLATPYWLFSEQTYSIISSPGCVYLARNVTVNGRENEPGSSIVTSC